MGIKPGVSLALKPRFSGWQNLAQWNEQSAVAERELVMTQHRQQQATAVVKQYLTPPRTDYIRPNGSLETIVERFANQNLSFEHPDGTFTTLTGGEILKQLTTTESVTKHTLHDLDKLQDMMPQEYEALGRSNQYIQREMLAALGGMTGNKGVLYRFLDDAYRQGVVYLLKDHNPNRVGKTYYGVPAEVRTILNALKAKGGPSPADLKAAQADLVKDIHAFFGQANVQKQPDAELFEFIANFARAASSPVANLDGFGYGDVPITIRQTPAFASSSETSLRSTLLSLLEATQLVDPHQLAPQVDALAKKAVAAGLIPQEELDEVLALR